MWRLAVLTAVAGCSFEHGASGLAGGDGPRPGDARGAGSDGNPGDAMATAGDAAHDASTAACPSGYSLHDAARPLSYYRSVTASDSWTNAEADCKNDATGSSLPGHLIVLDDQAELTWAYAQNNSIQWVGETDAIVEAVFLAVTDQILFFIVPTGNNTSKDCVVLGNFSSMTTTQSEACSNSHPYLCECDGLAEDSLHF